ncbi:MAG TPA: hypothetical protein VK047_10615 [Zeimonas sp.]|nr:hypothetical protein [Zeimonas sp.]
MRGVLNALGGPDRVPESATRGRVARHGRAGAFLAAGALATFVVAGSSAAQERAVGSSAATLYALNCMGCHPAPKTREHDRGPLRGEFYHSNLGRNFFIRMPPEGRQLTAIEEARLLEEVLTWKRACAAIRQDAPMVDYRGDRHVR